MIPQRLPVFVISLALVLLVLCSRHRIAPSLDDVKTYLQDRPDSSLATLRAIDTTRLSSHALRARYALLYAIALDKNWIDTSDVSVILPAVNYYDRHPSGNRRAKAWYYLGRIQENGGNLPEASISFLKAELFGEHSEDKFFQSLVYQSLSIPYGSRSQQSGQDS